MSLYAVQREPGVALYALIAEQLRHEVLSRYSAGDGLPAESLLAQRFGVNRHTLRRAVDELVDAGMLERRHGLGMFVLDHQLNYPIGQGTRFTENLAAQGLLTEHRILRKQTLGAIARVAQRLGLAQGEPVHWIETLRLADGRPMCVTSHFLPAARFGDLLLHYEQGSLHSFLQSRYGCDLRRTESLVTAVLPQGDDAKSLGMPQNRPVLRVKSLNVENTSGTPLEYAITRFRADRIELRINP